MGRDIGDWTDGAVEANSPCSSNGTREHLTDACVWDLDGKNRRCKVPVCTLARVVFRS